jgi:hypothetical protein
VRQDSEFGRCPQCDRYRTAVLITCPSCGHRWYGDPASVSCPSCGAVVGSRGAPATTSMPLWKEGRYSLTYVSENGLGFVYLWDDDMPVTAGYMHEAIRHFGMDIGQIVAAANDGKMANEWKQYAADMYRQRNGYEKYIDYFMKKLFLSRRDARILSIHFTGMGLEAISKKFGLRPDEIREAFDRIMKAYADSGIIVDDTVFTQNPFDYY